MVRSTQRLLTEFLLLPSSPYELVSFCPGVNSNQCKRTGCHCNIHTYPTTLDCGKDKDLKQLQKSTIAHFAGSMLDYKTLCDPKSGPKEIKATIDGYVSKALEEHQDKLSYNMTCQIPMLNNVRHLYLDAIRRHENNLPETAD